MVSLPSTYKRVSSVHPRVHAKELDREFGFKIPRIEHKLLQKYRAYYQTPDESNRKQHYQGTQTWIGLHPQGLQTPYNDIFDSLSLLKDFDINKVVDIGAGYGRVGLVMNSLFPDAKFVGFEILKKRKEEGNRIFENLELENCKIILKNVLDDDFELPKAQVYFIYDFSEMSDICQILDQLVKRLSDYSFFLITKGERVDYLIGRKYKQFWLANGFLTSGELKVFSSIKDLSHYKQKEEKWQREK